MTIDLFQDHLLVYFFQDHQVLWRPFINWPVSRPLHSLNTIYHVNSFKTIHELASFKTIAFFQQHLSSEFFQDHLGFFSTPFISWHLSRPLGFFKTIYQWTSFKTINWLLSWIGLFKVSSGKININLPIFLIMSDSLQCTSFKIPKLYDISGLKTAFLCIYSVITL